MGTPNVDGVFRVPGRLCVSPTSFATAWPHGGTGLGVIAEAILIPTFTYAPIVGEEFGQEVIEYVKQGEVWVFAATLREWSQDLIQTYFPNATGAGGANKIVVGEATSRPGTKVAGVALLFTPNEQTVHPAFYAKRAVPLVREGTNLNLALDDELAVGIVFACLRSATGTPVQIGLLTDLTI